MGIQSDILLFFSSLHNGASVFIADVITTFGTELPLIAFLLFIYYSIDKKKGALSCLVFMIAANIMGILKAVVRFPRPWTVIKGLDSQSVKGATGYSFPSGHTTSASSAYSSLAIGFKKKWLSITCAVLILLVGLSRMFLCVHWPLDVAGGLIVGCGTTVVFYDRLSKILDDKNKLKSFLFTLGLICSSSAVVLAVLLCKNLIDSTAFSDLSKSLASLGGMGFGFIIESSKYNFEVEEGFWGRKVLRYLLSMVGILIILPISKVILSKMDLYNPFTAQIRYFLTSFWATVFPLVARKLFPKHN